MIAKQKHGSSPAKKNSLLLFEGLVALVYFMNGIYHFPSWTSIFEITLANLFLLIMIISR